MRYVFSIFLLATLAAGADDYTGPRPPKADVLYLVHASNLIPTEVTEAQQEGKKDDTTFSVAGAASSARGSTSPTTRAAASIHRPARVCSTSR